jgi:uncharacterized membrane protein YtjA (UPF0391 family)
MARSRAEDEHDGELTVRAHGGLTPSLVRWCAIGTKRATGHLIRGKGTRIMTLLKWALIFLVVSIIAGIFGFTGISAASADIARILFYLFVVIFLVLLILGLTIFRA